jgi:hypothetical protein
MYTIWLNEQMIGETALDLPKITPRKLAGFFHPTDVGLTVLPRITAMVPALFDFGDLCRRSGLPCDVDPEAAAAAGFEAFSNSSEGQRLQAAAAVIAQLEVRDSDGRDIAWESILISDATDILELSKRCAHASDVGWDLRSIEDPIRYFISVTFAKSGARRRQPPRLRDPLSAEVC